MQKLVICALVFVFGCGKSKALPRPRQREPMCKPRNPQLHLSRRNLHCRSSLLFKRRRSRHCTQGFVLVSNHLSLRHGCLLIWL